MRPIAARFLSLLFLLLAGLMHGACAAEQAPIPAMQPTEAAIGRHAAYLKETDGRLSLEQAIAAEGEGKFKNGDAEVLNFGIGAKPAWIHFSIDNATPQALLRQVAVENAWLDKVHIYIRHGGRTEAAYRLGDRQAFWERPIDSRFFVVDHAFEPGISDVFVRIETPDPMAVPVFFLSPEQARAREAKQDYFYGALYGFIFALLVYNAMLYAGLRKPQYLLYSAYLGAFLLMNMSYTGHAFLWLWPAYTHWTQWANPVLMVLFGTMGLMFAMSFLNTRAFLPRAHKAIAVFLIVVVFLELLGVLLDSQVFALLVAFPFAFLFIYAMMGLGVAAVRSGSRPAKYFLLAAIFTMIGATLTTASVWGVIPHNALTFHAVEAGMALDATLLALALSYQFRIGQEDKLFAERLATIDPLTGINNRRAFSDKAETIWNVSQRNNRNLCIILLDIDRFKHINDTYGHACGDQALKEIAKVLMKSIREQDVAARWGGEEFILLLPETDLNEAAILAERVRNAIEDARLRHAGCEIAVTASLGVAQRGAHHASLEALISSADKQLYLSKERGRNCVSYDRAPGSA